MDCSKHRVGLFGNVVKRVGPYGIPYVLVWNRTGIRLCETLYGPVSAVWTCLGP